MPIDLVIGGDHGNGAFEGSEDILDGLLEDTLIREEASNSLGNLR